MKKLYFFIGLSLVLVSCKKDEKSNESKILNLTITESSIQEYTTGPVVIDERLGLAFAFINRELEDDDFPVSLTPEFTLSAGAKITPESGQEIIFIEEESAIKFVVIAEDGSMTDWYVAVRGNQLPNFDFEDWYEAIGLNSQPFLDPGLSAETSPWSTANIGTSTYGVYGTTPLEMEGNTIVQIATIETSTVPVAAGTIYTGRFNISEAISNPTDPRKATDFGTPFPFRPTAASFDYSYKSGPSLIMGTPNDPNNIFGGFTVNQLIGSDEFRVYVIMDIIEGETVTEIGRGVLEDGNSDVISETIVPINYTSTQTPTHITVMFTSSKGGGEFTGAVGSTLLVDNLHLLYE